MFPMGIFRFVKSNSFPSLKSAHKMFTLVFPTLSSLAENKKLSPNNKIGEKVHSIQAFNLFGDKKVFEKENNF